ncbi:L-2-amino-thiazoline-4-carboxylic acid hydrolase [uncultured Treponema sp.]|uniref:L-2-amino-thiazoline-4-carboxylic acid hydrolase n=1 Tax=uncultured Treponema sp. TaxID=162155 RepID=UPI00338EE3F0
MYGDFPHLRSLLPYDKARIKEYIPAMCSLDYDMAALNNTEFSREFTLAGGGKYCDCHYNHIAIN